MTDKQLASLTSALSPKSLSQVPLTDLCSHVTLLLTTTLPSIQQALLSKSDFAVDKWTVIYEAKAIISFITEQWDEFERAFGQLEPFYFSKEKNFINTFSVNSARIVGLALLCHLLKNTCSFNTLSNPNHNHKHSQSTAFSNGHSKYYMLLARVNMVLMEANQQNPFIQFARNLQLVLDEGAASTVFQETATIPPSPEYGLALIRVKGHMIKVMIAEAIEKSMQTISVQKATQLLMCDESQLKTIIQTRKWKVQGGIISVGNTNSTDKHSYEPSQENIVQRALVYASELTKII